MNLARAFSCGSIGLLMTFGIAAAALAQTGERYAVIVGVSNYPAKSGAKPLPGAANDARLMRETLERNGFKPAQIRVLADEVPGAQLPTRANILGALDVVITQAKAGDFVHIHFSGHGSQQPVDPKRIPRTPEPDGLNETFLPIDIGSWDGARSTVTNAIIDYELDERLEALLQKGVFVWAVFDACHAETLMRGGSTEGAVLRQASPLSLGIPPELLARGRMGDESTRGEVAAEVSVRAALPLTAPTGGFVVFYAAQTTQEAPEDALPFNLSAGDPRKKRHGVFTFMLAEALNTHPGATYRQLGQYIHSRYSSLNISKKPAPVFNGTRLDDGVFGASPSGVRQWALEKTANGLGVRAGLLAQITDGSVLAILNSPLDKNEDAIGLMDVWRADLFTAELRPVSSPDGKSLDVARVADGAYARLVRTAVSNRISVALPVASGRSSSLKTAIDAVIDDLKGRTSRTTRLDWVAPAAVADVRLHIEDERVWLLPRSGALVKRGPEANHSWDLTLGPKAIADAIDDALAKIANGLNLIRLAERLPAAGLASTLDIKIERLPRVSRSKAESLNAARVARLEDGDQIRFSIQNNGSEPVDVTILYMNTRFAITPFFPLHGAGNRLQPGGILRTADHPAAQPMNGVPAVSTGYSHVDISVGEGPALTGVERFIVIAAEGVARAQRELLNFTNLAQAGVGRTRSGASGDALLDVFEDSGVSLAGDRTRAGPRQIERAWMQGYTFQVVPALSAKSVQ